MDFSVKIVLKLECNEVSQVMKPIYKWKWWSYSWAEHNQKLNGCCSYLSLQGAKCFHCRLQWKRLGPFFFPTFYTVVLRVAVTFSVMLKIAVLAGVSVRTVTQTVFSNFGSGMLTTELAVLNTAFTYLEDLHSVALYEDGCFYLPAARVFVHCAMGLSRSSTLVLAYLMIHEHMTLAEAITAVSEHRNICPNSGFLEQLRKLDQQLHCLGKWTPSEKWLNALQLKANLLPQTVQNAL